MNGPADDLTVTTMLLSAAAVGYVEWSGGNREIEDLCREVGIEAPDELRALIRELGEIRKGESPDLDVDSYQAGLLEGGLFFMRMLRMPRDAQ